MQKEMIFAFIIVSLLIVPAALADTIVTSEVIADSVCPCSTIGGINDIVISVKNTGEDSETYDLEIIFPDDELWSGFIQPSVDVGASKTESVYPFITPSCWITPGEYSLSVSAVDSNGLEIMTTFIVEVGKCRWIENGH